MGILLGYLCLICLGLLLAKALTRRLRLTRADQLLMSGHKAFSVALALACALHLFLVLPVFSMRNRLIYVTGGLAVFLMILLIVFCHLKREGKTRRLRQHRFFSALILLCVAGHIVLYSMDFQEYQTNIRSIRLQELHLSDVTDGEYIGEYDAGYLYAKVQVTVLNGGIQRISLLEHRNERGQAAQQVLSAIVETQMFPVDAVSGATNSSKVIQKAVQNALAAGGS